MRGGNSPNREEGDGGNLDGGDKASQERRKKKRKAEDGANGREVWRIRRWIRSDQRQTKGKNTPEVYIWGRERCYGEENRRSLSRNELDPT